MKSSPRQRGMALIGIGLLGMGASQIISHVAHPGFMGTDFFHGLLLGTSIGLEVIGVYYVSQRKNWPTVKSENSGLGH